VAQQRRHQQTKEQNLRVLDWLVQQHDLHVELPDGRTADLPACIGVKVSGEQITRIDEYIDGTAGAAFA
jgi:hypothetical protein